MSSRTHQRTQANSRIGSIHNQRITNKNVKKEAVLVKTKMSYIVRTTRFWNNVRLKSKD